MDIYRFQQEYLKVKLAFNTDSQFFDKQYKLEDVLITNFAQQLISLNIESQLNHNYDVAYANIYKGLH